MKDLNKKGSELIDFILPLEVENQNFRTDFSLIIK